LDIASAFEIFTVSFLLPPFRRQSFVRRAAGRLWCLQHDCQWGDEWRVGDDFFICAVPPAEALTAIQDYRPRPDHTLIVVDDQPATLASYTAHGYRLLLTEYLMTRMLHDLPPMAAQYPVETITDQEKAVWANAHDPEGQPWIHDLHLTDPSLWHYVTIADNRVVARARAIRYDASCTYVTHVTTDPAYRRRGLARAVMLRLLHDCAARGETQNVLVASEEGDLLYRSLGYLRLATILY
jgi:GNAT superfamily N-acetyltransferase